MSLTEPKVTILTRDMPVAHPKISLMEPRLKVPMIKKADIERAVDESKEETKSCNGGVITAMNSERTSLKLVIPRSQI